MAKFKNLSQKEIADILGQILTPSRFGYRLVFHSKLNMKKGRLNQTNPLFGKVWETATVTNPRLGCNCNKILDALTERYNPSWLSQPHSEHLAERLFPYDFYNPFCYTLKSNPDKFYFHYHLYPHSKIQKNFFIIDGDNSRTPTPEDLEIIRLFKRKYPQSDPRQDARGIPPEHQLQYRNKHIDDLHQIWQGDTLLYENLFGFVSVADEYINNKQLKIS